MIDDRNDSVSPRRR